MNKHVFMDVTTSIQNGDLTRSFFKEIIIIKDKDRDIIEDILKIQAKFSKIKEPRLLIRFEEVESPLRYFGVCIGKTLYYTVSNAIYLEKYSRTDIEERFVRIVENLRKINNKKKIRNATLSIAFGVLSLPSFAENFVKDIENVVNIINNAHLSVVSPQLIPIVQESVEKILKEHEKDSVAITDNAIAIRDNNVYVLIKEDGYAYTDGTLAVSISLSTAGGGLKAHLR